MRFFPISLLYTGLLFSFPVDIHGQPIHSKAETKVSNLIKASADHFLKDCNISKSEFYLLDIRLNDYDSSKISLEFFQKSDNNNGKGVIDALLKKLSTVDWNCFNSDRIIIPIYLLPLFDDGIILEKPIILDYGFVCDKKNKYRQYIFKTIVLTVNKPVR